ncbi:MAG TPA: hypothetical protein VMU83_07765 [Hanamia sp.]|nr:hypothetical protein [Hanamia sp.]
MNFTITSQKKEGYLLIESKGIIENMEELIAHSRMVYDEIDKYSFDKILVREPELHLPLDLVPHFNLVKNYTTEFPAEIRKLKIAIVVADTYKEVSASRESICQSRGLQFFAFTSSEDAINCLFNGKDDSKG